MTSRGAAPAKGVVLAALVLAASGVWAEPLKLDVSAGLDARAKPGRWFPVRVLAENTGGDVRATLSTDTSTQSGTARYELMWDLPAQSRQLRFLYARCDSLASTIEVRMAGRGIPKPIVKAAGLRPMMDEDKLVLVISRSQAGLSFLQTLKLPATGSGGPSYGGPGYGMYGPGGSGAPSMQPEVYVAYHNTQAASQLPGLGLPDHRAGYDSVDMIVLRDISSRAFEEAEAHAISDWVAAGGTLVVVAGTNVQELRRGFLEDLLPVKIKGVTTADVARPLAATYGQSPRAAAPTTIADCQPHKGAEVRVTSGRQPLLVRQRSGAGEVYFMAFDCQRKPLQGWDALQHQLWRELLLAAPRPPDPVAMASQYRGYGQTDPSAMVAGLAQLDLPSLWVVAGFLGLYILVLVPANYYFLKWLDRRELAWVTTPGIVLAFSIGAYLIGHSIKGGDLLINEVRVARAAAGAKSAPAHVFIGLYSPRRTRYDLKVRARGATVREPQSWDPGKASATVRQGDGFGVADALINMWSLRTFVAEEVFGLGGGLQAKVQLKGADFEVTVTNRTPYDLEQCFALRGGHAVSVGALSRGASQTVSVPVNPGQGQLANLSSTTGLTQQANDSRSRRLKRGALEHLFGQNQWAYALPSGTDVLVGGWAQAKPLDVEIKPGKGSLTVETLILADAEQGVTGGAFILHEPPTLTVLDDQLAQGYQFDYNRPGQTALQLTQGWMRVQLASPRAAGAKRIDEAQVRIPVQGQQVQVEIRNRRTGQWDAFQFGSGGGPVKLGPQYVDPALGAVEIKLTSAGQGWQHVGPFALSITGER